MKNEAWVELVDAYFADGLVCTPRPPWFHESEFMFGIHWKVSNADEESARRQWGRKWLPGAVATGETELPAWFWHAMLGEVMFGGRQVRWVEEDQRF